MTGLAPTADNRAPAHVAWTGTGDRLRPVGRSPADAVAGLVADERRAIRSLAEAARAIGVEWLTVQVAAGAAELAAAVRQDLGPSAVVRVFGAPWTERDGAPGAVTLTVVLAEGGLGRTEIVRAVAAMAADGIEPATLDEKLLAGYLFEPDVPDPDLVVVTGGDRRVPDLLTWEMAYSELVFLDESWPLVDGTHLVAAVEEFRRRNRRYGGIAAAPGGAR